MQWICAADRGADGSGAGEDSPDARPDGDRGVRGLEQTVGIESTLIANAASSTSPSRHLWHVASKQGCSHERHDERLGRGSLFDS